MEGAGEAIVDAGAVAGGAIACELAGGGAAVVDTGGLVAGVAVAGVVAGELQATRVRLRITRTDINSKNRFFKSFSFF